MLEEAVQLSVSGGTWLNLRVSFNVQRPISYILWTEHWSGALAICGVADSVCPVLPLHFLIGRFWLPGHLQHLLLCGIRKRPL
jgi:hypothetical protein